MNREFELFSENLEKCRDLIHQGVQIKESNILTSIKIGRFYEEKIKSYCIENIATLYNKLSPLFNVKFQIKDISVVFDFTFSQELERLPKDCEYLLEKDTLVFYLEQYLKLNKVNLMKELFEDLLLHKSISFNLFKAIVIEFINSQFFEDSVIHEITHRLQFKEVNRDYKVFDKKNNQEYSKNMYEFYAIKADLFNRCCREFEKDGIKDFSFEQLKNKMSKQGNGDYYKILINYKGVDFFNKQLKKDFDSYKKFGTLIECNLFSEDFFNKLKEYCSTEDEKCKVDDPEWRKWFIEITLKAKEEI